MFDKILIANRGEIACRVIKTARKMGIKTVAVYSDADKNALHVQMADEAIHIGPPPAAQSYLIIDNIMQAINDSGAQAVHPGYGFLSENASFVEALVKNGTAFIGPNAYAIEVMGDKIQSKKFADEAGVSTVPGFLGLIEDQDKAVEIADQIGYPVMIKASAGGGGKGMRIAHNADEAREGWASARSEAKSSFGDDRVFIEKFIVNPRHIEIQVLGDKHGNCIHLAERECSIQRRNQKVIEEAPSPFLDEETRAKMGDQAVALAKAVDYDSAGTVEFIVDQEKNFYFLEMNTRLQVEHPVTELITDVDLVEQMIKVAASEELALQQSDIQINGWALESRIYAEDPYRNFMPSIGRLTRYVPPQESNENDFIIRNDTGVYEGSEISMYYDPMIAKLCTHAPDRNQAIDHMSMALNTFELAGIEHNIPFLSALMDHPRWREGNLSTAFIEQEYPDGFTGAPLTDKHKVLFAAAASSMEMIKQARLARMPGQVSSTPLSVLNDWCVKIDDDIVELNFSDILVDDSFYGSACMGGTDQEISIKTDWRPGLKTWTGKIDGDDYSISLQKSQQGYIASVDGVKSNISALPPHIASLAQHMPVKEEADTSKMLLCPMPGLLVTLHVEEGQQIKAGDSLCVVEAMKMENILKAEQDGTIKTINAAAGDSLQVDEVILEFE